MGALMRANEAGVLLHVEACTDEHGNYEPHFYVTGDVSRERLHVWVVKEKT